MREQIYLGLLYQLHSPTNDGVVSNLIYTFARRYLLRLRFYNQINFRLT